MGIQGKLATFALLLAAMGFSGCAKSNRDPGIDLRQLLHLPAANANFGPLYPHLNSLLQTEHPDVATALRDSVAWAEENLDHFLDGSCATSQTTPDADFTNAFGQTTLGVTFPWMQIYIRDGVRRENPFLWKDVTLFVSTVLHEYVHAAQREHQSIKWLGTPADCQASLQALTSRRSVWDTGFHQLHHHLSLAQDHQTPEQFLLQAWISPIFQARDEIEASLKTVQWMDTHPEELNALTLGGANNWAYGVQYLHRLKALATSNCFSADDETYKAEKLVYAVDMPLFAQALASYEPKISLFLQNHGLPILHLNWRDFAITAAPAGRQGHQCRLSGGESFALPLKPIPIDAD